MRLLATISLLLLPLINSFAQDEDFAESPSDLAQLVFNSLREYDLSFYQSLIATKLDCEEITVEESDSTRLTQWNSLFLKADNTLKISQKEFSKILDQFQFHKIDPLQTSIMNIESKSVNNEKEQYTSVELNLRYMDVHFTIHLPNCAKASSWVLLENAEVVFQ